MLCCVVQPCCLLDSLPLAFAAATRRPCRGPAVLCSLPKSAPCRSVIAVLWFPAKLPLTSPCSVALQLEMFYLSKHTNDDKYRQIAQRVVEHMDRMSKPLEGLYPIYVNPDSGQFTNDKITFGAMGDSFYEYLLKMWLITGKTNEQYRRMYEESMNGLIEHLLTRSPVSPAAVSVGISCPLTESLLCRRACGILPTSKGGPSSTKWTIW